MDNTVLSDNLFFMFEEEGPIQVDNACMWVAESDIIRPSTSLTILKKLNPGIYKVDMTRDYGLFCKKVDVCSDELFQFSNSIIPSLVDEIDNFWSKAKNFKDNNLIHKRGILLYGNAGTGKTSLINLLCESLIKRGGVIFIVPNRTSFAYYTSFMKTGFRVIEPDTPVITVIEDIDKYIDDDLILDFLDGKDQIDHHVVITTSNNTSDIPESLLRPSRIDLKIEVPLPSEELRKEFLEHKQVPSDKINEIVEKTKGFSLADLKELFISIFLLDYSLEESVSKIKKPSKRKNYNSGASKVLEMGV